MIKNNFTNLKFENDHLTEEILLMLVDGELSAKEASGSRDHLETCWTCRRELEKIEETISHFIEFRQKIQIPLNSTPPQNWNGFNGKLGQIRQELSQPKRSWFDLSNFSPFQIRLSVASVATILIFALFIQLITVERVSASQLLEKATVSELNEIMKTESPVVYRKLKVRSSNATEMNWEVWNDAKFQRAKQIINGEGIAESTNALRELAEILQKNKMSATNPLSLSSFKNWRNSLTDKTEEVIKGEAFTLNTKNNNVTFDGQIIEATVKFRDIDFHPFEQILRVKTVDGEKTFEIAEVEFEVVSLNTLKPNFFDETPTSAEIVKIAKPEVSPSPTASASPSVSPSPSDETNLTKNTEKKPIKPETVKIFASPELEVEALRLLNEAKADLGEEITVKREGDGLLYVRGMVESTERKNEILRALQSLQNNPAVRVQLKTVNESMAELKNTPKPSVKAETVENDGSETASDSELLAYFKSEQAARSFGRQIISRSSRAMSHAYALRRLVRQFKAEELRGLSEEARNKWLGLIRSHAGAFRAETEAMRRELQPVFDGPNAGATDSRSVNNITAVPSAVETLLDFATTNDRIVRSAFTISPSNARFSAIKTVQFWQSLKNAEALAAKLQAVK